MPREKSLVNKIYKFSQEKVVWSRNISLTNKKYRFSQEIEV